MFGEWLREASVLIGALGWLEKRVKGEAITLSWALETLLIAFVLLAFGVVIELVRPKPAKDGTELEKLQDEDET
jgi:hypothetical protein